MSTRTRRPRGRRSSLVHAFASPARMENEGPLTLTRGRGAYVWDADGKRYLDGLSSLWNVGLGHGRREIVRAVAEQMRRLTFAPTLLGFSSEPAQELARRITRRAPGDLSRVVFTSGGSEANESMIRLVRLYGRLRGHARKTKIVALNGAYHGSTTGAASLTGLPHFHRYYEPLMPGVRRMARPYCYRCELGLRYPECAVACADELERIVEREGADTIGAFVAEPVQGVGGVIVPPPEYWARIRAICNRHDILMVADEVITGFGRLGHFFGIERWGVVPDLLVFAKGVTSGYLPLGGVILREPVYRVLLEAGESFALHHGFTYSGHPAVCAAAIATLDVLESENILARVRRLERPFASALHRLARHPIVGDVRAIGLMGAIEIVADRKTKRRFPPEEQIPQQIRHTTMQRGVIVRASTDTIVVCPPLISGKKELDLLVHTLDQAIEDVVAGRGWGLGDRGSGR